MLELTGITAGYGATTILRDVTLRVPESSVVALLGPNGAGKTTTLKVMSGLLTPIVGAVRLDGEDITPLSPEKRVALGLGHVVEGRGIFRTLTVQQNLRLQTISVPESEAIERAVDAFPVLGERLGQVAGTLSGGEQQMLALARAYIERPRYILLDEISLGLAPIIVDQVFEFLQRLIESGAGLLIVEQYVAKALELADYVFILKKGEIAFAGDVGELGDEDLFVRYLGRTSADVT